MKKFLAIYIFACMFWACSNKEDMVYSEGMADDVVSVTLAPPVSYDAADDSSDDPTEPGTNPGTGDDFDGEEPFVISPLVSTGFDTNSIIYLSQIGTKVNPNVPEGYNALSSELEPDFSTKFPLLATDDIVEKNFYSYKRNDVDDATWDNGFNFEPLPDFPPIEWGQIRKRGPVGNSYNLIALYFPYDNTTRLGVEEDQSSLENLLKSDVLGAFHSTSILFSRLRFRLFHLMTYVRVTLYVPVYDSGDNSGFLEDAFKGAWVLDVLNDFRIEYRAGITSDTRGPVITAISSRADNKGVDVAMYAPQANAPVKTNIKVSDYFDDGTGQTDRTDEVYAYTFHALIPFPDTRYNSTETNKVDFLKFSFDTPGGNTKSFYFNDTQRYISDSHTGSVLSLNQGAIQDLFLYVPRGSNGTIYVKANVSDWNDSAADVPMFDGTQP